jgi:DHA1 family multidrug resistance protein-like MFS transporter
VPRALTRLTGRSGGLPREVLVLGGVAFAVALGFGFVAPAIPVFARHFGVGRTAAGGVISVFAGMRLVCALGAGRLVERLGERLVLATGIAVVAVSSALAGLATSYPQLLVLRGIGGAGSAMFSVSAATLLLRSVGADQRGRASGLFQGGFLLGGIAGPALGGFVTGVSIRLPFFLYAGTLAAAGTIGLLLLPRAAVARDAATETATISVREALRSRAYRAALAAQLADSWAVLGVRSALVPLFVVEGLHASPVWTGVGFVVVAALNAVVLLPAGRLADSAGRRPVLAGGCFIGALSLGVLALPLGLPGYLASMALLGLGSGMLDVAPAAVVGDVLQGRGGTVVAAYQMAGDVGSVSGPLAAGRLADMAGFGAAFGLTAVVMAGAGALALAAPETRVTAKR